MYQICISGAHSGRSVGTGRKLAEELGIAVAKAGHSLLTGATIGLPNYAAEAYKKAGGKMSVGLSPATSKIEHVMKYRLPTEAYDTIIFTGLHYVGRDLLLINSADAVLSVGGRLGTLHEFTIAMETETPIGLLKMGGGGVSEEIVHILKVTQEEHSPYVIFAEEPEALVERMIILLNKTHKKYLDLYR
jgi:hypothetical protein